MEVVECSAISAGMILFTTRSVTPNAAEAGALLGRSAAGTREEATLAARDLCEAGAKAALVTGAHLHIREHCIDVLYDGAREASVDCQVPRVGGRGAHGTGCALSSAIARLLALGRPLADACELAQRFVAEAIEASGDLEVGAGAQPVNSLHRLWRCDAG